MREQGHRGGGGKQGWGSSKVHIAVCFDVIYGPQSIGSSLICHGSCSAVAEERKGFQLLGPFVRLPHSQPQLLRQLLAQLGDTFIVGERQGAPTAALVCLLVAAQLVQGARLAEERADALAVQAQRLLAVFQRLLVQTHGEVAGGPVDMQLAQQLSGQGHLVGGSVVGHIQPLHVLHQGLLIVLLTEQVIALGEQILHQLEQEGLIFLLL